MVGLITAVMTYLAAFACASAQLYGAVVFLLWPNVVLSEIMPDGEPVTPDSPSSLWLPIASFTLAWLVYSVASFYWPSRRRAATDA